jgi:hypothetical protein
LGNRNVLVWLTTVAAAFGCVEAATVTYIRLLAAMPPGLNYHEIWARKGLPFNGETIVAELHRIGILPVEYVREVATLVLLLAAAMLAGRPRKECLAAFVFSFAVWDLTYYAWLRIFCGFPRSFFDTDIYFLLPFPTFGPVWLPLAIMSVGLLWSVRVLYGKAVPGRG